MANMSFRSPTRNLENNIQQICFREVQRRAQGMGDIQRVCYKCSFLHEKTSNQMYKRNPCHTGLIR